MKDKPKSKEVDMSAPEVKQHKRMAAGVKVDGQTLPGKSPKAKQDVKK